MTVNEAKAYIDEALSAAIPKLESTGLTVEKYIDVDENETPDGNEVLGLLGVLSLYEGQEKGERVIFLPLSADVSDGSVNESALISERGVFDAAADRIAAAMSGSLNKAEEFARLMKEIDDKEEAEYQEHLRRLNEGTKKRLRTAIIATAALLAVAAVCFIIKSFI